MKILTAILFLFTLNAYSQAAILSWVNDTNNPFGTLTVASWGPASGVYTNSITVPYGVSTVTISNIPIGVRIYFAVQAFDGVTNYSIFSNEVNSKSKPNPPKNLTVTP